MPLKINSKAPDFNLSTSDKQPFGLYENLKNGAIVLFFYPKNFTAGCTREVCAFRDDFSFFDNRNIKVVGISADTVESHQRFGNEYQITYSLLSDPGRKVARLYKALYPFELLARRVTYLIHPSGKILSVFDSLTLAQTHIEDLKEKITKAELRNQLWLSNE